MENSSFSIDFICSALGVSRSNLHRKIKAESGISTSLFIRKRKIQNAKTLIENTDLTFSEISYAIGINNAQNFSKYFQQEFGLSPSTYRKEHRNTRIESKPNNLDPTENANGSLERLSYVIPIVVGLSIVVFFILYFINENSVFDNSHSNDFLVNRIPVLGENSIAVLPFTNLNPGESTFFSDGVMEDILTNLTKLPDLKVISRTSSILYRDTDKSLKEIGSELGVNYILEGSVRSVDNKVKITVQLIRSTDDTHVWAQDYDRDLEDIFEIQSEVSKKIALALSQNLSKDLSTQFDKGPTSNLKAYNSFVTGRELIHSRRESGLYEGLRLMEEALMYDSLFADAYAFKALAYSLLGNLHYEDRQRTHEQSISSAKQALKIDDQNDMAWLVLGSIYNDQHKWQESIDAFKKVIVFNPNSALGNYWYSLLLREIGELDRAVYYSAKAAELDPLLPVITAGHVSNCGYLKDFEQSNYYLNKGEALFQNSFLFVWAKGIHFEAQKNYAQALEHYSNALKLNPKVISLVRAKMYCHAKLGHTDIVNEFLNDFTVESSRDYIILSTLYCGLDDTAECLKYLTLGSEQNLLPDDLYVDARYDPVRGTPEFQKLIDLYNFEKSYQIL